MNADTFQADPDDFDPSQLDPTKLPTDYASVEPLIGKTTVSERAEQTFYQNHVPQPGTNEHGNCQQTTCAINMIAIQSFEAFESMLGNLTSL